MSIQLLTTCEPDAIRGAATTVDRYVNDLSDEFTPLNLRALALTESDWEGEAAAEFRTTWIEFRTACGILVEVMRDTAEIMTKLAQRLALAQRQFESALEEARAAGLQVDMATGEVTPPPVALSPEPVLPVGGRELETADAVRRANLEIQDAIREAVRADQEAERELAALQPQVDEVALALKALGISVEAYGGLAGSIAAAAQGIVTGPQSAAAERWQRIARHPAVRAGSAPLPGVSGMLRSVPGLTVAGTGITYAQNVASGDSHARAATRAVTSSAATLSLGAALGAGVTAATTVSPTLATGLGGVAIVGGAFVLGVALSFPVQQLGDEFGQWLFDDVLSLGAGDKGAARHVRT